MNKLINTDGTLNIESLLMENPSLKAILEDGIITKEECYTQSEKVISILKNIENTFPDEHINIVRELMAEMATLIIISQYNPENYIGDMNNND